MIGGGSELFIGSKNERRISSDSLSNFLRASSISRGIRSNESSWELLIVVPSLERLPNVKRVDFTGYIFFLFREKKSCLSTIVLELKLTSVLLHELLEAPERNDLPKRNVHCLRPRFGAKNSAGFINELSVEFYRCRGYRHGRLLTCFKHTSRIFPLLHGFPSAFMLLGA